MERITDQEVSRYRCLLMYDDERVLDAVIALRNAGGQEWWHLAVDLDGGKYAVGKFSDLAALLDSEAEDKRAAFLEKTLGSLVGETLSPVKVVADQEKDDSAAIREKASASPSQTAVVLKNGEFVGILSYGGTRSASRGLMDTGLVGMAGKYAEIPQVGVLSPRRKKARTKQSAADTVVHIPPPTSKAKPGEKK